MLMYSAVHVKYLPATLQKLFTTPLRVATPRLKTTGLQEVGKAVAKLGNYDTRYSFGFEIYSRESRR